MTAASAFTPRTILVTGGAGFIGSNLVRHLLERDPQLHVINLDLLTYAGSRESLADVASRYGRPGEGRYTFVHGDIRNADVVARLLRGDPVHQDGSRRAAEAPGAPPPDALLHLAAESHVDRSILGPAEFVSTNVQGTLNLLACTRAELESRPRPFRFVNVSTDEVYGTLGPVDPPFNEASPIRPNSPYSASKAGADHLVRAYRETFGMPALTTRCSNNYGPYQFPEKLIPLMITRALAGEPLPVYGDGRNVRDWLHVRDHAEAIWTVMTRGPLEDEVYNVGGNAEAPNIEIVRRILDILGKPESLITFVEDRPGHDRRYAIDASRIHRLGWRPAHALEQGLVETVEWYRSHASWWRSVRSRASRIDDTASHEPRH